MALTPAEKQARHRRKKRRNDLTVLHAEAVSEQINRVRRARGDVDLDDTTRRVEAALRYAAWRDEAYERGECVSPASEYGLPVV